MYTTLSETALGKFQYAADKAIIAIGYVCAELLPLGCPVKLNSDGTVSKIAAATDVYFGTVQVENKEAGGKVTVATRFKAVIIAQANSAVTTGQVLDANALVSGAVTYSTTTTNGNKSAMALSSGADTEAISVGIFW